MSTLPVPIDLAAWTRRRDAVKSKLSPTEFALSIIAPIAARMEAQFPDPEVKRNLERIAQESPESIARMAKVAAQPQEVKDALAAQVDGLPES